MATTVFQLQPTFDDGAEPVALLAALTPIGRGQPQIERYGAEYLEALETRHARIICEGGAPLLLDLSESGATTRNGRPVGNGPVTLSDGDLLKFGGRLEFRVEPMQDGDLHATRLLTQAPRGQQLLLTPIAEQGPDAPIAITEFPFLISSVDGHFASYQTDFPDPMSFLSRRHAHIYQSEGGLLLEDLGSTNGTRLNGEPLKEQAVPLASGDEVRFGHKQFTFAIAITAAATGDTVAQQALPDGTVMISSAGSFLDVYCDDAPAGAVAGDAGQDTVPPSEDSSSRAVGAWFRAIRLRWQSWPYLRARQIGVVLLPVMLLTLTLLSMARDTRPEEIADLLDANQAQAALSTAVDYANDHPGEAAAQGLLESAFEGAVLPGWIERMQSDQPAAARDYLDARVQIAPSMADSRTTALLRWMSELALYRADNRGAVAVSLTTDNAQIQELAAEWRGNADQYTRLLRRFTDAHTDLGPVHSRAMSSIRQIQGEGADQLKAVGELQRRLATMIAESQFDAARTRVEQFAGDHPQLGDMEVFRADLEQLARIAAARADQDLTEFLAETENLSFASAFFSQYASGLATERRQALDVHQQLTRAAKMWREGKLETALEALSVDERNPWRTVAGRQRDRYAALQRGFAELLSKVGTSAYPDAVIDFYAQLDDSEDPFMRQALADDFANQRDRAVASAEQLAARGANLWMSYKQTFQGIGGGLRLEAEVSDTYRQLADQLTQSVTVLRRAHRLFQLLDIKAPASLTQQVQEADQEVARQRSALASLRFVLGDALVQEKLNLLPTTERRS